MLDGLPLVDLTAPALLGITVLLLLLGRIVPRSSLVDKIRSVNSGARHTFMNAMLESHPTLRLNSFSRWLRLATQSWFPYSRLSEVSQEVPVRFRMSRRRRTDSSEAALAVADSLVQLAKVKNREPEVLAISTASRDFRKKNHFAEDLQLLFEGGR